MKGGLSHFEDHHQMVGATGTEGALREEALMAKVVLSVRALTVQRALTARALTGEALAERAHTAGDLTIERAHTASALTIERAHTAGALTTERALTAGILTRKQADLTAAKRVHLRKAVMFQCTRDGVGADLPFATATQQARGARRSIVEALLLPWIKGTEVGRGKRAGQLTAALRVE